MGTSLLRYLGLFCHLSTTSHARRTQTSTERYLSTTVAATAALHYLQADDEPFNQTSTQQIKTGLPKPAGNVKNIAATEWLARQGRHFPSCTAKHLAFEIDLFKFNMAERNQFQASAPTISKPKTASYLKPFLASRNTFHFQ